jgi:retron-type reverse transcriptase
MQLKLHRWASEQPARRFDDLYNLVYDPTFLMLAWQRVRTNVGARTPGIDRATEISQRLREALAEISMINNMELLAWRELR